MKKFFTRLTAREEKIAAKAADLEAEKAELSRLEELARRRDSLTMSRENARSNFNQFMAELRSRAGEKFSPQSFVRAMIGGARLDILVSNADVPKFLTDNFDKLESAARENLLEPHEKALRDFERENRADLEKLPQQEAGEPPMPKAKPIVSIRQHRKTKTRRRSQF